MYIPIGSHVVFRYYRVPSSGKLRTYNAVIILNNYNFFFLSFYRKSNKCIDLDRRCRIFLWRWPLNRTFYNFLIYLFLFNSLKPCHGKEVLSHYRLRSILFATLKNIFLHTSTRVDFVKVDNERTYSRNLIYYYRYYASHVPMPISVREYSTLWYTVSKIIIDFEKKYYFHKLWRKRWKNYRTHRNVHMLKVQYGSPVFIFIDCPRFFSNRTHIIYCLTCVYPNWIRWLL